MPAPVAYLGVGKVGNWGEILEGREKQGKREREREKRRKEKREARGKENKEEKREIVKGEE